MSDEIRAAFEYELKKGWPQKTPSMWPMFESGWNAGYTSRDAEISELVEAMDRAAKTFRWYQKLHIEKGNSMKAIANADEAELLEKAISSYTKTPCPECGELGKIFEHDRNGSFALREIMCPTCQGRGYKWERKG